MADGRRVEIQRYEVWGPVSCRDCTKFCALQEGMVKILHRAAFGKRKLVTALQSWLAGPRPATRNDVQRRAAHPINTAQARITASNNPSTRRVMSAGIEITRPHSRLVSPGHLWVASSPILPPRPLTGDAKSR